MEYIDFEDEEYSEGLYEFTEQMRAMGSEETTIGAEPSTSPIIESERTRTLTFQKATVSTTPPSPGPMDVDSGTEDMQVEKFFSPGAATTAIRMSPTNAVPRPVAIPAKRPTDTYERPGSGSFPPSARPLPQPAPKRLHAAPSAPRKSPQPHGSAFGADLDEFIIAHDESVQSLLDAHELAWGTIYEIARGITKGTFKWSSVTRERVEQLRGTNAHAAHRVAAVMEGRAVPWVTAGEIWIEYDREQDAILENKGRGLGGMGHWKGKDNWYGGRIQQVGRLVWVHDRPVIQLEKPEIRRSHRFSRYLGSRRVLQVRIADDILYKHPDAVNLLSSKKFVLCGRVFLPFHAKEGSMYLLETRQDFQRSARTRDGDDLRISLNDFVTWHNPLHLNSLQPISKWSTRWALGLSTSIPTIEFLPENIYLIPDVYVSPQDWKGKAPAEKVLTDGCGFINGSALTQIMRVIQYNTRPTAVQGRIGGSKGMWILHPSPEEQVPDGPAKIWIRDSQSKINLGPVSTHDLAHRIFDLLAPARVTGPSNLSSQTLVNLSSNGISHQLLKRLMAFGLQEELQPFLDWTHPHSMVMVWKAVERAGNVVVSRLKRSFSGQARAMGLGQLHPFDNQGQEEEVEEVEGPVSSRKLSGQPFTLYETVLELLQSGFHPLKLELLFHKLESVMTLVLDNYVEKFHIPIVESCEAYVVPDPYGVLEEGEIHFRSSEPIVNRNTGEQTDIILGDVLVSRNPTRLLSDIQKVKAVAHPKLSNYFDVIVFPIKGNQSLASFLGGGDYDGDTVMINWCKPLVDQFRGSSLCTAPNISAFFEREVEYVKDFDRRISKLQPKEAQSAFQKVLLLGLAETRVGLYSKFHDAAVYEMGYGHSDAIHLAYMFTTCLDASKTGLRVKQSVFDQDRQKWGSKKPWYAWKLEQGKSRNGPIENGPRPLKQHNSQFILDALVEEGEKLRIEVLRNYRALKVSSVEEDPDLSGPWNAARAKATQAKVIGINGLMENLEDINTHIEHAKGEYQRAMVMAKSTESREQFERAAQSFARSPAFRGFVFFSDDDIQTLKASLAAKKSLTFAFSVAFRDLCAIKAHAAGNISITHQFAQCISIPNVVVRTFSQALRSDL